jgi:mono/diheme cytochrome c family protein
MKRAHIFTLLAIVAALPCAAAVSGEAVYKRRCAACHDSNMERTPPRAALQQLSVARILRVLDFGVMINVGYLLNREEREAVANYLGVQRPDAPVPEAA